MVDAMTGRGHRVAVAAGVLLCGALLAPALFLGCSSSHSNGGPLDAGAGPDATLDAALDAPEEAEMSGPNTVPGQCVFQNNVWYCGAGYGTYPSCPGAGYPDLGTPCDAGDDAGDCVGCSHGVATTFGCQYGSFTIGSQFAQCNH
jgi:hypothetical protein